MCNFYTALKEKKWRKIYLRCLTWGKFFPKTKCRRRVSKNRLERAQRFFTYWQSRNRHLFWDFDNPFIYYYDIYFKKKMSYYVN